ncbi:MAG: hypothetical protein AAF479_04115 [Pseudomonadota bacterium]
MKDQALGTATLRCPLCGEDQLEHDPETFTLEATVKCSSCEHWFVAHDGIDQHEVERAKLRAVELVHNELRRSLRGLKNVKVEF